VLVKPSQDVTDLTFVETFRDRNISGQIYFIRLKDGVTVTDETGEPVKLNWDEAAELTRNKGKGLLEILGRRTYEYVKPVMTAGEVLEKVKPKRGRPKANK
jgi:hypothetical protein